jgi:hypothetical protein
MNHVDDYKRENPLVLGPKGFRSLKTNKDIGIRVGILIGPSLRLFPLLRIFRPDFSFNIILLNINETAKKVKIEFIVQTNFTINYIYTAF